MVEPRILGSYGKLYIWKTELIFPSDKWNYSKLTSSITVEPAQTLCKMTTRLKQPMLSLPQRIPIQSLLYKTTTCLTWPATTFLFPKWKKAYLKQPLKNFIQQRNGKQHEKQYIKNKRLCLYLLHCYSLMLSLFNVYKSWTNYQII